MEIAKEFTVEAAHRLPNVPPGHKCERLHGHSFRIEPIFDTLDHNYMNEVEGLENPTSENLALYIWQNLAPRLPGLSKITIHETCNTACIYRGK